MTAFAVGSRLDGGFPLAPIGLPNRVVPAISLRRSWSSSATTRHELDLWDLEDLEDEVAIDLYGPMTSKSIESILVPVAGGPNSDVAIAFATNVARSWDATLVLLTVLPSSADGDERREAESLLSEYAADVDAVPVETRLETDDDVVSAIAGLTTAHELVVIGASEGSLFRRLFGGTIPERLERTSEAPIFVVGRQSGE